jgi:hypothetical protein
VPAKLNPVTELEEFFRRKPALIIEDVRHMDAGEATKLATLEGEVVALREEINQLYDKLEARNQHQQHYAMPSLAPEIAELQESLATSEQNRQKALNAVLLTRHTPEQRARKELLSAAALNCQRVNIDIEGITNPTIIVARTKATLVSLLLTMRDEE